MNRCINHSRSFLRLVAWFRRTSWTPLLAGFAAVLLSVDAWAQTYPSRPIKLVVPYPAGGSTDVAGRLIASEMAKTLGQPVVVENRTGGAGAIGIASLSKAPADGYTLGVSGVSPTVIMDLVGAPTGYKPAKDLTLLGMIGQVELIFVARKDLPANNIGELIRLAKAQPGKITYASAGQGGNIHVYWAYLSELAGVRMTHVPYRGDAPTLVDLMGGQIDVGLLSVPGALAQVQAGKVKALGLGGHVKLKELPNVPLVSDSGLPGFDVAVWNVLVGPAGLPAEVVEKANHALNMALQSPQLRSRFADLGMSTMGGSPAAAHSYVEIERERWRKVISKAGITAKE